MTPSIQRARWAAARKQVSLTLLLGLFVASAAAQPPPTCVTPPAGMVSWWPGDGNTTDIQSGNNGTLKNGATFAAGEVGQAFSFDGVDDYVDVGNPASLNITGPITVDAWIKPNSLGSTQAVYNQMSTALNLGEVQLRLNANGTFAWLRRNLQGAPSVLIETTNTGAVAGVWQHIAAVFDGSTLQVYINGVLDGAITGPGTYGGGDAPRTRIGADDFGESFNGLIDEVEVFNRALSGSEIQAIHDAGSAGKCKPVCITPPSGLIGWWPGDNTAIDIQNNNNGTLQGGATFANGKVGRAFSFSSNGDELLVLHKAGQNPGAQITVDAWIRLDSTLAIASNVNASIINKRSAGNNRGYTFELFPSNGLNFEIQTPGGVFQLTASNVLTANVWQHVAATYNGTTMRMYVDGSEVSANTPASGSINAVTDNLVIGRNIVTGQSFPGLIDEVELFNRALSLSEVQAIYNARSAGKCKTALFYVSNTGNNTIEKLDANGADLGIFTSLNGVIGLAFDASGNLYAASGAGNVIEKFDLAGNGTVFANSGLSTPRGIAFGSNGNLYAVNSGGNTIEKFDSAGSPTLFANSGLNSPIDLAFDANGNLYVTNNTGNTIEKFDSAGNPTLFANSGLNGPSGIAFDISGNLYVANNASNTIEKFDSAGNPTLFANSGLNHPNGLAFDASGNLYAASTSGNTIEKFDLAGNGTVFANSGLNAPVSIAVRELSTTAATHFAVSAPASATAGSAFNFTVTALDQFNSTVTGYSGTVHFTSGDGQAVLPADSTLTNGTGTFSATLKTAGGQTITATDTVSSSITGTSNTIAVSASAATHYAVSAPASATAGSAFNFTVTAQDQFNNTANGYGGTVHFTSSDGQAVLPANGTLTSGTGTFSATLKTAGGQTITATDTSNGSITGTSSTITVGSTAATHYSVSAPSSATAGSAFNFTVTAQDQFNNTATGYSGTVHFTSSDGQAALPNNSALTNGTGTFSATLKTAGGQTITATDTSNSSITGTSNTITVGSTAATHYSVSAPSSATAGSAFNFTVTAQDQFNNTVTGYSGTVHFTSSDGQAVLPTNSTLTNGAGAFSATLKTAGGQTITATDTASSSITGTSNTITVSASAATHYSVSAPSSATAGSAFNFTVTALDQFNNTATGYTGTVHFTSSDGQAVLPANSTLTNGTGTFSATLKTVGGQTITATDTASSSITGTSNTIAVSAAAATHYNVSAPASTTAGTAFSVTVTALDQFNNTVTGYAGTVHFTSSDAQAVLPANSTLTNGTGTFSATLKTVGGQTITATDTASSSITGTSNTITVGAATGTHLALSAPASVTAGSAFNFTVTALDKFNNTATGYAGTVHFTSSDIAATLPSNSTLTNGTGTFSATLKTAGNQTITATDTANSSTTGASNTIAVSAAAATHCRVSAPSSVTANMAFSFAVTARDQFENTATAYAGTVHFTSSDAQAVLPANSTLTNGVGTFNATLKTAGNQTITARDTVTASITGTSNTISVSPAPTQLANISARVSVGVGNNVGIGGFIVRRDSNAPSSATKRVIIRGIGPSLQVGGTPVAGRLIDPTLELHDINGALITSNDDWMDAPNASDIQASGLAPTDPRESAILVTLSSNTGYTAILGGKNNLTGIGLVEIFDLDPTGNTHLANISTRATVFTGDNVLIGGVIVQSAGPASQILFRAIGPSLESSGVPHAEALQDPTLDLYDVNGTVIAHNDNWQEEPDGTFNSTRTAQIAATGLAPSRNEESAILTSPPPGAYTAIVRGKDNTIGIGLIEVFRLGL